MKYAIAHIADIHYRKEESEGAQVVLKALIDDLKKQKESLLDYKLYLAITGDIVYSGNDDESYSNFYKEFDYRLNTIGINREFRIIVPGNHDLDRSIVQSNIKIYQDIVSNKIETEQTFNDFIGSGKFQDEKFQNYMLFETEFSKYGIDFSLYGKGWIINNNLGIYCLNTSLCSFGGFDQIKDKRNLAIFTRDIINWCNKSSATTNILLMHHPFSYLTKWSKDALKQVIEKKFCLCLCGHSHEQDIFYNKISNRSLICSAPQVFTNKYDLLGYAIILIENDSIDKIIYREYVKGVFLHGQRFSENDDGTITVYNNRSKNLDILKHNLKCSLSFFKGQPEVFIRPKISKNREFNDEPNLLDQIINDPKPCIIVSHPQFGLTCLSHYMRIEAYKSNNFWIYLDSKYVKARNLSASIERQLKEFDEQKENIKCIIVDSWDSENIDHRNILKSIDQDYRGIPIIVMSSYPGFYCEMNFNFSYLNTKLEKLHLQAMQRDKVRELVSKYNHEEDSEKEDLIVARVVKDLEAINAHRTPFNILTLLKVFERDFSENLINRTKMIKAVFTVRDIFFITL